MNNLKRMSQFTGQLYKSKASTRLSENIGVKMQEANDNDEIVLLMKNENNYLFMLVSKNEKLTTILDGIH